jgi:copper chaperone
MKHEIIKVENIKCNGCMNTIRKDILRQPGVFAVHIDEEQNTVHISGDDDMDRTHLVARLEHLGYPETGHNNIALKAKSFVSCAVGRMTNDSAKS